MQAGPAEEIGPGIGAVGQDTTAEVEQEAVHRQMAVNVNMGAVHRCHGPRRWKGRRLVRAQQCAGHPGRQEGAVPAARRCVWRLPAFDMPAAASSKDESMVSLPRRLPAPTGKDGPTVGLSRPSPAARRYLKTRSSPERRVICCWSIYSRRGRTYLRLVSNIVRASPTVMLPSLFRCSTIRRVISW